MGKAWVRNYKPQASLNVFLLLIKKPCRTSHGRHQGNRASWWESEEEIGCSHFPRTGNFLPGFFPCPVPPHHHAAAPSSPAHRRGAEDTIPKPSPCPPSPEPFLALHHCNEHLNLHTHRNNLMSCSQRSDGIYF